LRTRCGSAAPRLLPTAQVQLVVFERREEAGAPRKVVSGVTGSMGLAALGFETLEAVCHGHRRVGALLTSGDRAGWVVDLNRALAVKLAACDAGAPEAQADSLLPADMTSFLRRLPDSGGAARAALDFVVDALERYDAPNLESAGVALQRKAVRLVAPVPAPGKLLAVDAEGADGVAAPELFLVAPTAVAGPEDEMPLPAGSRTRCRGQLALVIGRRARALAPGEALGCVAGYCAAIALSAEGGDLPAGTIRGSGDGFSPMGPALVTLDEVPDPHDLRLELRVSGRAIQSAHTKELPIQLSELLARASALMTLEPGDVVLSGAPLGGQREEPRDLRDGDVVELEIERVGRLALYARAAGR
jgi:2-keto-4-pentenoate hydratase/2-oxohepta-3-ene-1,7-dioic acid hydratase in catechol pathway